MAFISFEQINIFPPLSHDVKVHLAVISLSLLEAMVKGIVAESIHSVYFPYWALMCPSPHPLQWKHHQL